MQSYLQILRHILATGVDVDERTGTGAIAVCGYQYRHLMRSGFPLLTTKKIHMKSVIAELLWFLSGNTNVKALQKQGVKIWNDWADEGGELGPVYGAQWRSWRTADGVKIDQIDEAIKALMVEPNSRRILVSAWNVGELQLMRLPPCHLLFQFHSMPMNMDELRLEIYSAGCDDSLSGADRELLLSVAGELGVPTRNLTVQVYQR